MADRVTSSGSTTRSALVVGATGIIGRTLAERLAEQGWQAHGLSRRTASLPAGVTPVAADLALVTGLKHYLGPFENYATNDPVTPFREEQPRVPGLNFYYGQEDVVRAAAAEGRSTWSVHRPHTLVGYAVGRHLAGRGGRGVQRRQR